MIAEICYPCAGSGEEPRESDEPPRPSEYMPAWPEEERTHWQMYENTTEGTPISPAMETPEDLAQWLVANKASAFGTSSAPYGRWMEIIMKESE